MYELVDRGNKWEIHTSRFGAFEGTYEAIIALMLYKFEFTVEELDMAISDMCKSGHNTAHFGIFRGFIYSYNREDKKVG